VGFFKDITRVGVLRRGASLEKEVAYELVCNFDDISL